MSTYVSTIAILYFFQQIKWEHEILGGGGEVRILSRSFANHSKALRKWFVRPLCKSIVVQCSLSAVYLIHMAFWVLGIHPHSYDGSSSYWQIPLLSFIVRLMAAPSRVTADHRNTGEGRPSETSFVTNMSQTMGNMLIQAMYTARTRHEVRLSSNLSCFASVSWFRYWNVTSTE
jgi:hypothetical protein